MLIRPRALLSACALLADVSWRVDHAYGSARGGDPMLADLTAVLELAQQQRLLIEQWEALCRMRCPGTEYIAEMVRAMEEGQD